MEDQASTSPYRAVAAISTTFFAIMTIGFFVFVYFDHTKTSFGSAGAQPETAEMMETAGGEPAETMDDSHGADPQSADHSESTHD